MEDCARVQHLATHLVHAVSRTAAITLAVLLSGAAHAATVYDESTSDTETLAWLTLIYLRDSGGYEFQYDQELEYVEVPSAAHLVLQTSPFLAKTRVELLNFDYTINSISLQRDISLPGTTFAITEYLDISELTYFGEGSGWVLVS